MKNGKRTFILTEIVLGLLVATLAFFMLYNKNMVDVRFLKE